MEHNGFFVHGEWVSAPPLSPPPPQNSQSQVWRWCHHTSWTDQDLGVKQGSKEGNTTMNSYYIYIYNPPFLPFNPPPPSNTGFLYRSPPHLEYIWVLGFKTWCEHLSPALWGGRDYTQLLVPKKAQRSVLCARGRRATPRGGGHPK